MGAQLGSRSGSGRRGRRAFNAEINVTPFVDVMLVLLIVFMVTAPLLTTGIDVSLPKTSADAITVSNEEPLYVTLQADGTLYIQNTVVEREGLVAQLIAITDSGFESRILLRTDEGASAGEFVAVMGDVRNAGFSYLAIVSDPKTTK